MRDVELKLKELLEQEIETYVPNLSDNLKDEKFFKLLGMGLLDGRPKDEIIKVQDDIKISCRKLIPTQNQISLLDSLGWISKNEPDQASNFIRNITTHYQNDRILVANKKFILDGHHRWLALSLINPDAEMPVVNLEFKGIKDEKEILKIMQMGIALTYGDIFGSDADEKTDLFDESMTGEKLKQELSKLMGTEMMKTMRISLNLRKNSEVIDYVYENAMFIKSKKPRNSPLRKFMPQPTKTAKKVGRSAEKTKDYLGMPAEFIDTLKSGKLNYKKPFIYDKGSDRVKKFEEFRFRK